MACLRELEKLFQNLTWNHEVPKYPQQSRGRIIQLEESHDLISNHSTRATVILPLQPQESTVCADRAERHLLGYIPLQFFSRLKYLFLVIFTHGKTKTVKYFTTLFL